MIRSTEGFADNDFNCRYQTQVLFDSKLIYCHQKRYVIGCYDYFGECFGRRFSLHNDDLCSEEGGVLLLQYLHHQNI